MTIITTNAINTGRATIAIIAIIAIYTTNATKTAITTITINTAVLVHVNSLLVCYCLGNGTNPNVPLLCFFGLIHHFFSLHAAANGD